MNRFTAAWAVLALAAAGAAAVAIGSSRALRSDVDALRAEVERLQAKSKSEPPPLPPAAVEQLRRDLARVEAKAEEAAVAAKSARPAALPSGAAAPGVSEEDLRTIVDEQVEEKLKAKGGAAGDRKLPLHDLGKELGLDPQAQAQVETIANGTKKEIFALIRTPRPDGTDLAGDVVTAFLSGEPQKAQAVFARLFTEKVPGTEQTYAAGVAAIQDQARAQLQGAMGDAVYTQYRRMGVNPENIETGFDPWAEYVKEKGLAK